MGTILDQPIVGADYTPRRLVALALGIYRQPRTYLSVCYLLASFPLGLCYFIALVVGLSVGFSLAFVGVGLLILLLTTRMWWGLARFERHLVMWWLGVPIRPMAPPREPGLRPIQRIWARLRNPVQWKSLVYLLIEFPFGILALILTLTLTSASLTLTLMPLIYAAYTALYNVVGGVGTTHVVPGIAVTGSLHPTSLLISLALVPVGIVLGTATLWLLTLLGAGWGQFARLLLGMSETEARLAEAHLAEARATATAEQAEQKRRELVVNVSHELRTPIASIRGHVESLLMPEDERPPEVDQEAYLRIVEREAERLSALVDDLLAVARADANELRLDLRPIAVDEVIEEVYAALAPLAKREREVTLVRNVSPGLPPIWADRARLAQVLLNLVRNAIAYTPQGGIVSLAAERGNEWWVTLLVADTGVGIPPEELPRIFERFYRTDVSRTRASGGFGLGLSIVKDLVQAMGGGISVESTPGAGTTFRVVLRAAGPGHG